MLQYRLSTLFLLFVVLASSMVAFGNGGAFVAGFFMVLAFGVARLWKIVFVLLGLVLLGLLLLPAVSRAREAARCMVCACNMKQLSLALLNYHATYDRFPPVCIPDKNGRPMHSWRVLILPYIDRRDLYRQYRFDEPWDGRIIEDCWLRVQEFSLAPAILEIIGVGGRTSPQWLARMRHGGTVNREKRMNYRLPIKQSCWSR